jgi:hypothetical protein
MTGSVQYQYQAPDDDGAFVCLERKCRHLDGLISVYLVCIMQSNDADA